MPSSMLQRSVPCSLYCASGRRRDCWKKIWFAVYLDKDTYQVHNDFAIRVGLEFRWVLQAFPQGNMVVDLSVDGEDNSLILVD
jgi:hypothetical protein